MGIPTSVRNTILFYTISVTGIKPEIPLENREVEISFQLKNNKPNNVLGTVTSTHMKGSGEKVEVQANGTYDGSIICVAPGAGKDIYIDLKFSSATSNELLHETYAIMDVAAKYTLKLEKFNIERTRATFTDTDFASFSSQVGGQEPQTVAKKIDNVKEGSHEINLQLGPFELVPGVSPDLVFSYLIINRGHPSSYDDAKKVLDTISGATKEVLNSIYPAFKVLWDVADKITKELNELFTVNCDGKVAEDKIVVSSSTLDEWTKNENIYSETRYYPGTDSNDGCGANSKYYVTWTVTREKDILIL